jgi:hypothetical protein
MILDDLRNIVVRMRMDFASDFAIWPVSHKLWQLYIEQQETALPAEQIAQGLRAFLPRPEGRGLTRILVKTRRVPNPGHGMHTVVERAAGSIELAATV